MYMEVLLGPFKETVRPCRLDLPREVPLDSPILGHMYLAVSLAFLNDLDFLKRVQNSNELHHQIYLITDGFGGLRVLLLLKL